MEPKQTLPGSGKQEPALSPVELQLFNQLLSTQFGFHFPEQKCEILESRLRPLLAEYGLPRFYDYYVLLQQQANGGRRGLAGLVSLLTNNETYFFRETGQMEALFGPGLDRLRAEGQLPQELRLLCAGCSSGEEAYTLKFYAMENQYRIPGINVAIDAFDVDEYRIRMARQAVYRTTSMRGVSREQQQRYFTEQSNGTYLVRPLFRKGVRFFAGNIVDPACFTVPAVYDAVYCRNVMIYFTDEAMLRAVEHFAFCLRPGGLLFLGHSESIIGKTELFEPVKLGSCIAYCRVC